MVLLIVILTMFLAWFLVHIDKTKDEHRQPGAEYKSPVIQLQGIILFQLHDIVITKFILQV